MQGIGLLGLTRCVQFVCLSSSKRSQHSSIVERWLSSRHVSVLAYGRGAKHARRPLVPDGDESQHSRTDHRYIASIAASSYYCLWRGLDAVWLRIPPRSGNRRTTGIATAARLPGSSQICQQSDDTHGSWGGFLTLPCVSIPLEV